MPPKKEQTVMLMFVLSTYLLLFATYKNFMRKYSLRNTFD